jgi:excisionase family DNA binding protein
MTASAQVIDFQQARARRVARANEPWVGKPEIAAHLGVSLRTVERWMAERGLPFRKRFEHGVVRFRVSEVDEWMEGNG